MRHILSLTSVSVLALGLAVAGPAFAQSAAAPNNASSNTASSQAQPLNRSEIRSTLAKAGVNNSEALNGHIVWAQDASGQSVALLISPQNAQAGNSGGHFDKSKLRSDLTKAGFKNVVFAQNPQIVRGQIANNIQVLAFGSPAKAQAAHNNIDTGKLINELKQAGVTNGGNLNGKLLRTRAAGPAVFVLVGPKNFKAGSSLNFTDRDINKFMRDGFLDASMYNNNITAVQGRLGQMNVIAVAGSGIGQA